MLGVTQVEAVGEIQSRSAGSMSTALRRRRGDDARPTRRLTNKQRVLLLHNELQCANVVFAHSATNNR